jgi:AAA domain
MGATTVALRGALLAQGGGPMTELRVPLIICMADVQPEEVSWLWYPYIPRRKQTLLEGDPGSGKSWLALTIASLVSRGDPFPGDEPDTIRDPANVLYLSAEDGLADTVRKRLDAAGADVNHVHTVVGWQQGDTQGCISLGDLPPIEASMQALRPALMVVDPIQGYLGASVDMHRANEVRPVLAGLAALAEQYDCAIMTIRHLTKSAQDRAVYRGLGSIDFAAAARSILLAGQDPHNPRCRVMAHVKSSLAPLGASIGYELRENRFWWTGRSDVSAEDLLRPYPVDEERSAVEEAQDFPRELLADGKKPAKAVISEAKKAGISEAALKRARAGLVCSYKAYVVGGKRGDGAWVWTLVQGDQGGNDHTLAPDELLERPEKPPQIQDLTDNLIEAHVSFYNENGNHQ